MLALVANLVIVWWETPAVATLSDTVDWVSLFAYPLVGVMIARRHPRNPIGWVFIALGLTEGVAGLLQAYGEYTLINNPGVWPGGAVAALTAGAIFPAPYLLSAVVLLTLVPDGRPLSRRWGLVPAVAVIAAVPFAASFLVTATIDTTSRSLPNPYAAHGLLQTVSNGATIVSAIALATCLLLSVISLGLRFRRATGIERQQLKWIVAAGAATLVSVVVYLPVAGGDSPVALTLLTLWSLAAASIPIAAGFAILRYRLYEIDLIIRKTLVYAALAATLALVYLGGISLTTWIFRSVTGQSSALAVTLSTLAVAAAFHPLRTRIQRTVDHHFYRRRYDAGQTLEAFSGRLREEIDLDALHTEVLAVVTDTLQPSQASLWLRRSGDRA